MSFRIYTYKYLYFWKYFPSRLALTDVHTVVERVSLFVALESCMTSQACTGVTPEAPACVVVVLSSSSVWIDRAPYLWVLHSSIDFAVEEAAAFGEEVTSEELENQGWGGEEKHGTGEGFGGGGVNGGGRVGGGRFGGKGGGEQKAKQEPRRIFKKEHQRLMDSYEIVQ